MCAARLARGLRRARAHGAIPTVDEVSTRLLTPTGAPDPRIVTITAADCDLPLAGARLDPSPYLEPTRASGGRPSEALYE